MCRSSFFLTPLVNPRQVQQKRHEFKADYKEPGWQNPMPRRVNLMTGQQVPDSWREIT
jgi:hypothetical protein